MGSCFDYPKSKACQYAFDGFKVWVKFPNVNLKNVQASLQTTLIRITKSKKGKQEQKDSCNTIEPV